MDKECESSVDEARSLVPTTHEESEIRSPVKFSFSLRVLLVVAMVAGIFGGVFISLDRNENKAGEINLDNMASNDSKSMLMKGIEVNKKEDYHYGLDIFLIGFPKCGEFVCLQIKRYLRALFMH